MSIRLSILLLFLVLQITSWGQDTLLLKKHSWSFTAGANIIIPNIGEYREVDGQKYSIYYSDFIVEPKPAIGIYSLVAYHRALLANSFSQISISPAVTFNRTVFKSTAAGSYNADFSSFTGVIKSTQVIDYFNISISLTGIFKINKITLWLNQIGIEGDFLEKEKNIYERSGTDNYVYNYPGNWRTVGFVNNLISYQSGLIFKVTQYVYVAPVVKFPLFYFDRRLLMTNPNLYYKNIMAGITFILTKK